MPYGLPHGLDRDPEALAKMERCVSGLMDKGYEEGRAVAICKATLFGDERQAVLASERPSLTLEWTASAFQSVEGSGPREFLVFRDAVLARPEVNRNRDGIPLEGIRELAATVPLTPITKDHMPRTITGFFTGARVDADGALRVDGVLFARRFPEVVQEVLEGKRGLSVEAVADIAICSVCGGVFTSPDTYCEHIMPRGEERTGVRWLRGLKAIGGATTLHPAGTDCTFSMEEGKLMLTGSLEGGTMLDIWGEAKYGHKSPPKGYPQDRDQYADPENYKYPIDEEHIRAAIAYYNREGQRERGGYTEEEWRRIGERIAAAATRHLGRPYVLKGGKVVPREQTEESHMEEQALQEDRTREELEALRARVEELTQSLAQAQQELSAAREEAETLKETLHRRETAWERANELRRFLPESEVRERMEALGSMTEEQYGLLLAAIQAVGSEREVASHARATIGAVRMGVEEGTAASTRKITLDDLEPVVAHSGGN